MKNINRNIENNIFSSSTLRITEKAKQMKKEGKNVIVLAAGEPDFGTPMFIRDKAKEAIDSNFTGYTPVAGIEDLRKSFAESIKKRHGIDYSPSQIVVSSGAKQSLFNAILTLVEPEDEVIIFSPYWVSYPEMIKLVGAKPVIIDTSLTDFHPSPGELEKHITDKTKLVLINTPNNPTGVVYKEDLLRELSEVIIKYDLYCIEDEIYERLIYDGLKHFSVSAIEGMYERTVLINGVSKSYAMTGWRIGYSAASEEISKCIKKIQSHTTSCASSISQMAALSALSLPEEDVKRMVDTFDRRRRYIIDRFNSIDDIEYVNPEGAFYIFFTFKSGLAGYTDAAEIAEYILDKTGVALIPGNGFGNNRYLRMSYATSLEDIEEAIDRIEKLL